MSRALISRNRDLLRLQNDGYVLEVRCGHLLVHAVPYVNARREVVFGTLVSELTLAGDVTSRPSTHVVMFIGEHPCNKDGSLIAQIQHASYQPAHSLAEGLSVNHSFSNKPLAGYADYHAKMTRYVEIISAPAQCLQPGVSARTHPVIVAGEVDGVDGIFSYLDTASTRAGIGAVTAKLALPRIAIVGLGGTGSYVLDLVAKTPVREIHLYDGDAFLQHNAFRAPSAASLAELRERPSKVAYHHAKYSQMHRGIVPHEEYIGEANVDQLADFDFVFLCMDSGPVKKLIVETLQDSSVPFIDVGLGVTLLPETLELLAVCRVTTSTVEKADHISRRLSFAPPDDGDDYHRNIQVADLNALTASLAVIRWKKLFGFYQDLEREHDCTFTVNIHLLSADEKP